MLCLRIFHKAALLVRRGIGEKFMQCESCKANVPLGKAYCPECKSLVRYNVKGFPYTKEAQKALRCIIDEHSDRIKNTENLIGMVRDYLPDYDDERKVIVKALEGGVLDAIIRGTDRKAHFKSERERMISMLGFDRAEAEVALAAFGYMLGLPYPSPLMEEEKKIEKAEPVKKQPTVINFDLKVFGKLDSLKYRISKAPAVKEGYTKLEGYCFEGFGFMKTVSLPSTLLMIGEYAFTDCKKLEEVIVPPSVRKIEKGVFNACVSLKKVVLPEGMLDIGDNSFFCCTALEELRIPESVNSIGENAFEGCSSLKRLYAHQNIKFIDDNAFSYCPQLVVHCYENSYIHKYCMQNKIKFKTSAVGLPLTGENEGEE